MHELRPELLRPADVSDPEALFASLRDDARQSTQLAQWLVMHFSEATRRALRAGAVTSTTIELVIRDLNAILQGTMLLEDQVALPSDFWTRTQPGLTPRPPALRNRAVLDHVFGGAIRPMPRPHDAPSGGATRGPLHVVNMSVNVFEDTVTGPHRKAESFTASPHHVGNWRLGYRDARAYGGPDGLSLSTALAVSGVEDGRRRRSLSRTARTIATSLNDHLGLWLGNPGPAGAGVYSTADPRSLFAVVTSDEAPRNTDTNPWIYVGDGSDADDLGLWEMVLRRCHHIVLVDASLDPDLTMRSLADAIRKIRADLRVPIDVDPFPMRPRGADGSLPEGGYAATATIRYSAVDGRFAVDGLLLVVKCSIAADPYLPLDVVSYARESKTFPHEPAPYVPSLTEAQFDSYRALGRHAVNSICRNYPADPSLRDVPVAKEFPSVEAFATFAATSAP